MVDDYYKILDVDEDVSTDDLKRAFHKKARELHPDVSSDEDAEEKFKKVNEAYSVLSDQNKREEYDLRRKGIPPFGGGGFPGFRGFGDVFNDFFRGTQQQRNSRPQPKPIEIKYNLPVYSALVGGKIKLNYKYKVSCPTCSATGVLEWSTCQMCKGTGVTQHTQGVYFIKIPCPLCKGRGSIPKESCKECESGFFDEESSVEIDIKPGFSTSVFTMNGKGHEVMGVRGPLIVGVVVDIPDLSNLSKEDREKLKELVSP